MLPPHELAIEEATETLIEHIAPLSFEELDIDVHCIGDRWVVQDQTSVAKFVAIIALGQVEYAAYILHNLQSAGEPFSTTSLKNEAKITLTVQDKAQTPRIGYPRWQRDGFMFEAISWLAARQNHGDGAFLKDPHVRATTQGLDGLMIELSQDKRSIIRTTIFEDKCTDDPRGTFTAKVLPAFRDRHSDKRNAELISATSTLLKIAGVSGVDVPKLSAAIMDKARRRYRAAFSLTDSFMASEAWQELFDGYSQLDGLSKEQRLGAGLIVGEHMRAWFDQTAILARDYLDSLPDDQTPWEKY